MKETFYDWGGLNAWLFKLINGIRFGSGYDSLMLFLTSLGAHQNFKIYIGLLAAYMITEMVYQKLRGKHIARPELMSAAALFITLVMGYAAYGGVVGIMKAIIALPRPFMLPEIRGGMHFIGPYPVPAEYYASFPSGHAATMAFIVSALWYKFNHRVAHIVGIALIVLVCWSRLAIGMHFPADVLGGALLGAAIAYFVRRYVYRMMRVPLMNQPMAMYQPTNVAMGSQIPRQHPATAARKR